MVCGGIAHATTIKTVDAITLSIGLEVSVDEFFDAQYLVRNLASLFGIPAHRMKVPKIVAGSVQTEIEVIAEQPCDGHVCGSRGACQDESGAALCVCDAGYESPAGCEAGDCMCSQQSCAAQCHTCAAGAVATCTSNPDPSPNTPIRNPSPTPNPDQVATCTSCVQPLPLLYAGGCVTTCPASLYEDKEGTCQARA